MTRRWNSLSARAAQHLDCASACASCLSRDLRAKERATEERMRQESLRLLRAQRNRLLAEHLEVLRRRARWLRSHGLTLEARAVDEARRMLR